MVEKSPWRRRQESRISSFFEHGKLPFDFVRRQKIIGVQILDIIAARISESGILGRRETLMLRGHQGHLLELSHNLLGSVRGTVIGDNDFDPWPRLRNG
jgi:hypothetical protein